MKLNETIQLQESLSSVLFHATSMKRFISIVNSNELKLSKMYDGSGRYYMSFARSRTGQFINYLRSLSDFDLADEAFNPNSDAYVIMEFDGRALAANFKGKPFNTFHSGDDDPEYYIKPEFNFMEDRLYSPSPIIKNARRYITAIHFVTNGRSIRQEFLEDVGKIFKNVYEYPNVQQFMKSGVISTRRRMS